MALLDSLFIQFDADFAQFDAKANQAERRSRQIKQQVEKNFKFDLNTSSLTKELKRVEDLKRTQKEQYRQVVKTSRGTVTKTRTISSVDQTRQTEVLKQIKRQLAQNKSVAKAANTKDSFTDRLVSALSPLNKIVSGITSLGQEVNKGTKTQEKTTQAIKSESSTSLFNIVKTALISGAGKAVKNVAVSDFGLDTKGFEKFLKSVTPSAKIIQQDVSEMTRKVVEFSGSAKSLGDFTNNLAVNFADATAGANSLSDVLVRFKDNAKDSLNILGQELTASKEKMSNPKAVATAAGVNPDNLFASLLLTNTGKSVARGLSKSLDKPLAERKDSIQTERLGNVLDRAAKLLEADIKQIAVTSDSARRRVGASYENARTAVTKDLEELILVIGGFATWDTSGIDRARLINKQIKDSDNNAGKRAAVGLKNPDVYRANMDFTTGTALAVARPNLRGYSKDAEEMAAQAVAAMNDNLELKVKLVGESGGGFVVEEAIHILNKLGYGDRVQGAGYGTPSFKAKASKSDNFKNYIGTNKQETLGYETQQVYTQLGLVAPEAARRNPQVRQDLKGLEGHPIDNYFKLEEYNEFVHNEKKGVKQTRLSLKDIEKARELITQSIVDGSIGSAVAMVAELEDNVRIVGKAVEPFDQLKTDLQGVLNDVEAGVVDRLNQLRGAIIISPPCRKMLSLFD